MSRVSDKLSLVPLLNLIMSLESATNRRSLLLVVRSTQMSKKQLMNPNNVLESRVKDLNLAE